MQRAIPKSGENSVVPCSMIIFRYPDRIRIVLSPRNGKRIVIEVLPNSVEAKRMQHLRTRWPGILPSKTEGGSDRRSGPCLLNPYNCRQPLFKLMMVTVHILVCQRKRGRIRLGNW